MKAKHIQVYSDQTTEEQGRVEILKVTMEGEQYILEAKIKRRTTFSPETKKARKCGFHF